MEEAEPAFVASGPLAHLDLLLSYLWKVHEVDYYAGGFAFPRSPFFRSSPRKSSSVFFGPCCSELKNLLLPSQGESSWRSCCRRVPLSRSTASSGGQSRRKQMTKVNKGGPSEGVPCSSAGSRGKAEQGRGRGRRRRERCSRGHGGNRVGKVDPCRRPLLTLPSPPSRPPPWSSGTEPLGSRVWREHAEGVAAADRRRRPL